MIKTNVATIQTLLGFLPSSLGDDKIDALLGKLRQELDDAVTKLTRGEAGESTSIQLRISKE
jgi:hypothetical protein